MYKKFKKGTKHIVEDFNGNIITDRDLATPHVVGETVNCDIRLSLTSDFNIMWMECYLIGYTVFEYRPFWGPLLSRKIYFAEESRTLMGSPNDLFRMLEPDVRFNAQFHLHDNYPPNFLKSFMKVKYRLYVYARKRDKKDQSKIIDCRFKRELNVIHQRILTRSLRTPSNGQDTKVLCLNHHFTGTVNTNYTGYLENENIQFDLEIKNQSHFPMNFDKIHCELVQEYIKADNPTKVMCTELVNGHSIATSVANIGVNRLSGRVSVTDEALASCDTKVLNIRHRLVVHCKSLRHWARWCKLNLKVEVPIIICTQEEEETPNSQNFPFYHFPMLTPTIPDIKIDPPPPGEVDSGDTGDTEDSSDPKPGTSGTQKPPLGVHVHAKAETHPLRKEDSDDSD